MNENVTVCITPKGDKPILHFSQFDNERVFTVTVLADDGETAAVLTGLDIEFRIRKTDSHVVTIAPESVADNVITFKTTEQMCACCGQNISSVVLMKDDMIISTLDILVDIQRDILSGGLTSASDINNLTTQIGQIVPVVIGDDYYNKTEVDALIAEHTFDPTDYYTKTEVDDKIAEIPTFDPTNYYNKSDVDGLLADKADADDVYTKAETDNLLADKADISTVYAKTEVNQLLSAKANVADVYTKSETDNLLADKADKSVLSSLIVQKDVAKSHVASFNTDLTDSLTKCIIYINPVQAGSGTPSPSNPRAISGFSSANISVADEDMSVQSTTNISFGTTVYKGVLNVNTGKLTVTHVNQDLGGLTWNKGTYTFYDSMPITFKTTDATENICSGYYIGEYGTPGSLMNDGELCFEANNQIYIRDVDKLANMSANDFKTAMSGVQLVYELATPTEITLTPAQINAIIGDNNVYADTNGDIEVRFTETIGNELGV